MIELKLKETLITSEHLVALHEKIYNNNDLVNANKIAELYHKLINEEYSISFTGHFSAGKSSMINVLLEEDILPKSPIPTSGNIVEITSGEGGARIYFNNDYVKTYKHPYDIDKIKAYCMDNKGVKKVELKTSTDLLPKDSIIVDTPGIDAADDGDRIITESSLHLADQLIYIMDYNHVQSEVNLTFLKEIQSRGTPFLIVINQIDKHNDEEIAFEQFDKSINQTFEQWGLKPKHVYYTSLLETENKHNNFNNLKTDILSLLSTKRSISATIARSTTQIIEDHKTYLREITNAKLEALSITNNDEASLARFSNIEGTINKLQKRPLLIETKFKVVLSQTLNNAYLMPATLRDAAMLFLESRQKGFKIGLISSKRKTKDEQIKRLENFLLPLQKTIESTIQWKLRDKLIDLLTEFDLAEVSLLQYTQNFSIEYLEDDLISIIKPGAKINGDYVLNYTNDVSTHIKEKYKMQAQKLWKHIAVTIEKKTKNELNVLEKERDYIGNIKSKYDQQIALNKEFNEQINFIEQIRNKPIASQLAWERIDKSADIQEVTHYLTDHIFSLDEKRNLFDNEVIIEKNMIKDPTTTRTIKQIVTSIDETLETIHSLPAFQTIIKDLQYKKNKLTNRTLTIALFGAFSAGKSSFANALLGESILPSSPNPTTAVINQISPPTKEYAHGTVLIHLKEEETLINDILSITKDLSPVETDLLSLINWIKESKIAQRDDLDKMYQSYLQALITGYDDGFYTKEKTLIVKIDEFERYITDESKASYIESVTLHYDSPLARHGINLVDTPGADSVNARHTNVAFDYIKEADAILYVTYYNHALSRADKNFLMQLGRVKDAFELDKMFFIINASDLAESQTDLQLVIDYVEEQLIQLGIRFPRIFPVSSKSSLNNKQNKAKLDEEMMTFEKQFYDFINQDLPALSIKSALWDIKRVHESMLMYMKKASLNLDEQQTHKENLRQVQHLLIQQVKTIHADFYQERITQRIDRQLHFLSDRISIRFHDLFTDSFNPTTVTGTGDKFSKQLTKNLTNLIDDTGYELLQELRAISLRIESMMNKLRVEVYGESSKNCNEIDKDFMLPMAEFQQLDTPTYPDPFETIEMHKFNKAVSQLKGTRNFFEKNQKELMRDNLYNLLKPYIKAYIDQNKILMLTSYHDQWTILIKNDKTIINEGIIHYIEDQKSMIDDQIDLNILEKKEKVLRSIIAVNHERNY